MRRVHSFEWNSNSYSSFSHQNNKKVSLPPINETNFAPKSSAGWLHRSTPNIHAGRNTIVPMPSLPENIDDYFGSTMQSMSLAFFTFAYTEVVWTKNSIERISIRSLVDWWCDFRESCNVRSCTLEISHDCLFGNDVNCGIFIDTSVSFCLSIVGTFSSETIEILFDYRTIRCDDCCSDLCDDYLYICCHFLLCRILRSEQLIHKQNAVDNNLIGIALFASYDD